MSNCQAYLQDSHRTVFRSWFDLLGVLLAFWDSILKISKLLQNCRHRVIDITSFEKYLESFLRSYILGISVDIWWYVIQRICIKRNLSPGLLWWSSLQTKESQRRHTLFHENVTEHLQLKVHSCSRTLKARLVCPSIQILLFGMNRIWT